MSDSLVTRVSSTVFGTAVAGFGFSFGRDIYRKFKKGFVYLIVPALLLATVILPFLSASKTFRWHPISFLRWIFSKFFFWLCITSISAYITYILILCIESILRDMDAYAGVTFYGYSLTKIEFILVYTGFFYLIGALDGIRRRKKRKYIYNIEVENSRFLDKIGLTEVDGSSSFTHMDSEGNKFRIEGVGKDLVEFFVVGRRGKRAFIYLDDDGRFIEYSGIANV